MDIITSRNLRDFDEKGFFIVGQKVSSEWRDKLTFDRHRNERCRISDS